MGSFIGVEEFNDDEGRRISWSVSTCLVGLMEGLVVDLIEGLLLSSLSERIFFVIFDLLSLFIFTVGFNGRDFTI